MERLREMHSPRAWMFLGVAALLIPRKPVSDPEPESISLSDLEPSAA